MENCNCCTQFNCIHFFRSLRLVNCYIQQNEMRSTVILSKTADTSVCMSRYVSNQCLMFLNMQPLMYGPGPAPPGMTMMPMLLPDGRIGYVL